MDLVYRLMAFSTSPSARFAFTANAANKDLVVLGINVSDSPEAAQRYLDDVKPPWLVLGDFEGTANQDALHTSIVTVPQAMRCDGIDPLHDRVCPDFTARATDLA